jgi:hypothetical protein
VVSLGLLTLACIVLLPIVPAYFLFKALPSSASVTGPLQGLQVKLGGAFAGYFAVLLVVTYTHPIWAPAPVYQVWEVSGQVTDDTGTAIQPLDIKDFELQPPTFQANRGGTFKLAFSTVPAPAGGGIEYPNLTISHPNFAPVVIPLEPSAMKELGKSLGLVRDEGTRRITINHIALHKLPAYTAAGPPPASGPQVNGGSNP